MSLDNIKPLVIELGAVVEDIKNLTARKKELESAVRPVLASRGTIQFDNVQITVTEQAGRKTIDKDALIADGIDVEKYMKQGAPFTKMVVKHVQIV